MANLQIIPYTEAANEAALELEAQCMQGKSLVLAFSRPTFHARSAVYDNYRILCAKVGEQLVGTVAWTIKKVTYQHEIKRAVYFYDLRVHPNYRRRGVAKQLIGAAMEAIGETVDCHYTLVAGQNENVIRLINSAYPAQVVPLTYACIPVYRQLNAVSYCEVSARNVHETYLKQHQPVAFVPPFDDTRLLGHVASIMLQGEGETGCSIWTNEHLMAETVVHLPLGLRLLRAMTMPLRSWLTVPTIPKKGETIRSWFLFDFCAPTQRDTQKLVATVNNLALEAGRIVLYTLLQRNDVALKWILQSAPGVLRLPYLFLSRGSFVPTSGERLYLDIRDL